MMIAVLMSLIAGISTGIGALPIYFKREFTKAGIDFGMGFSAGVMLVASFVSLLIPSLDESAKIYGLWIGFLPTVAGLTLGYQVIVFLHDKLPHEHFIKHNDMVHHQQLSRVTLIILAICLHNVPEGLSVGVGFAGDSIKNGISLGIAIAIQNMPEGLVVALGLMSIGTKKHKAFWLALLSGMIEPLFALFGFWMTQISSVMLPFALAFACGAMLFVICQEMFPELFRNGHEKNATRGVLFGIGLMVTLNFLLTGTPS